MAGMPLMEVFRSKIGLISLNHEARLGPLRGGTLLWLFCELTEVVASCSSSDDMAVSDSGVVLPFWLSFAFSAEVAGALKDALPPGWL